MNRETERAQYRAHKARLTRAVNARDHAATLRAVAAFEAWADTLPSGWPDDWSRWQRAGDDARLALALRRAPW